MVLPYHSSQEKRLQYVPLYCRKWKTESSKHSSWIIHSRGATAKSAQIPNARVQLVGQSLSCLSREREKELYNPKLARDERIDKSVLHKLLHDITKGNCGNKKPTKTLQCLLKKISEKYQKSLQMQRILLKQTLPTPSPS
jgi:hypothetical protein